jgi:hypothetical protein
VSDRAMELSEIVVGQGPRNEFLETLLIEVLTDAKIPARFVTFSDVPIEIQPNRTTPPDYEVFCVLVAADHQERSLAIVDHTIHRCKICLHCASYIKPGESACKKCGAVADPRDPDEIRAAYHSAWLEHQPPTEE